MDSDITDLKAEKKEEIKQGRIHEDMTVGTIYEEQYTKMTVGTIFLPFI